MLKIRLPTPLTRLTEADDVNVSIYPGAEFWIEPSENNITLYYKMSSLTNNSPFSLDAINLRKN